MIKEIRFRENKLCSKSGNYGATLYTLLAGKILPEDLIIKDGKILLVEKVQYRHSKKDFRFTCSDLLQTNSIGSPSYKFNIPRHHSLRVIHIIK